MYRPLGLGEKSDTDHGEGPHPHHAVQVSRRGGAEWVCLDVPAWLCTAGSAVGSPCAILTRHPHALLSPRPRWHGGEGGSGRDGKRKSEPPCSHAHTPFPSHTPTALTPPEVQKAGGEGEKGSWACLSRKSSTHQLHLLAGSSCPLLPFKVYSTSFASWAKPAGGVPMPWGWGLETPTWFPMVLLVCIL